MLHLNERTSDISGCICYITGTHIVCGLIVRIARFNMTVCTKKLRLQELNGRGDSVAVFLPSRRWSS